MESRGIERRSETTFTIRGKTFKGKVNRHHILIRKEPEEIFNFLTDSDQFNQWHPIEQISVEKVTPGAFQIGTKLHVKVRFRIQPEWDAEVMDLHPPHRIVYRFLNGMFKGGLEVWDLKRTESGTEVTHTLLYQIDRWVYKMGWSLLGGEKKHDELTETALFRLKILLEKGSS